MSLVSIIWIRSNNHPFCWWDFVDGNQLIPRRRLLDSANTLPLFAGDWLWEIYFSKRKIKKWTNGFTIVCILSLLYHKWSYNENRNRRIQYPSIWIEIIFHRLGQKLSFFGRWKMISKCNFLSLPVLTIVELHKLYFKHSNTE